MLKEQAILDSTNGLLFQPSISSEKETVEA